MQDIVDKFDRAKELLGMAGSDMDDAAQDAAAKELMGLGIDAVGELIANSRRIAVALETIAENTKPGELIAGELVASSASLFPDTATLEDMAFRAGQAFVNGRRAAGENV